MTLALDEFDDFYYRHVNDVKRYIAARVMHSSDLEDIAGETFFVAWRRFDCIEPGRERAFLLGTARNAIRNAARGQRRQRNLVDSIAWARPDVTVDLGTGVLLTEQAEIYRAAFTELRPSDQELLGLVILEDLSTLEISVVLGISVKKAADTIYKAKLRYAKLIHAHQGSADE